MNSFKIRTFDMLRSHWSTMLLSRCTRWIENILKFWKIGMIIYLLANRSSFQS
ncbi:hypothetical protein Godav_003902 [Gossypium davidsonii]|uniref:Uncharacterized protein n=2 Tax=Gossypium TaxID=3633 RepID=A0A7J8SJ90_GOSDV|nr:hypothetical protein [Gossypium davidsonii]